MFHGEFYYKTELPHSLDEVWNFFQSNENLAAITTFPKIRILGDTDVFEGSRVHLEMNFLLFRLHWKGVITKKVDKAYFMDEGVQLPFPFQSWEHVHAFKEEDGRTVMIDRVRFSAWVPAPFVSLMLRGMFSDRKRHLVRLLDERREPLV
ncbi:SRPBCC family protein [Alkalicoccus chagannorensis]|uniref:SRPBCC family protein n=1 Tax=Alkalicoccus chagannorensis TaxID=427072 RepID=UPI00041C3B5F|nr:hypothetical protein [Alkalicoccus chagannorensis]